MDDRQQLYIRGCENGIVIFQSNCSIKTLCDIDVFDLLGLLERVVLIQLHSGSVCSYYESIDVLHDHIFQLLSPEKLIRAGPINLAGDRYLAIVLTDGNHIPWPDEGILILLSGTEGTKQVIESLVPISRSNPDVPN